VLKALRTKELVLIVIVIIFIPLYAFYTQVIAPKFGQGLINANRNRIKKLAEKVEEIRTTESSRGRTLAALKQQQAQNDERVARMRKEADEFKRYILNEGYEVELYQYLFGRDARYSIIGLGNSPRRVPKGSYTEIIYGYTCRGRFPDVVKMVKKIENTSRSLSISKLSLEQPKKVKDSSKKDDGSVLAEMQIHAIFSSLDTALTFEEFQKSDLKLDLRKIDGNPWDTDFGETQRQSEGPTAPIKKLYLQSVIYTKDPGGRTARFLEKDPWFRIGDEFPIEKGKLNTMVRLLAVGGRYVVVKHLAKNLVYKITLKVSDQDGGPKSSNQKEQVEL
jgi:hypothetical protein